ncbi:Rne/Rng family ribonuclease [Acidisoma cellulosilytica]|uniref:Ribonuclease E n=1 Tax=Acidisoma cellulosilyticum TaxID=2802395 RepID=A0A963YXF0_9PROT|nr:Rne/Rng family ribonuclease [Acidisoma cellulosilyticum]MCB8878634.1 Rne/Rng family ribonuclease [Acidisoma cellulosilyticum]
MTKRMLIDATHPEETRVVVLDGTRLEDFDVETSTKKQVKGNIYLAKVIRVEPSLQAAFVEYGGNRHGFLAFSEIHPDYYQIPVADRQKLLEAEVAAARAEAEAEDAEEAAEEAAVAGKRSPITSEFDAMEPAFEAAAAAEGDAEVESAPRAQAAGMVREILIGDLPPSDEDAPLEGEIIAPAEVSIEVSTEDSADDSEAEAEPERPETLGGGGNDQTEENGERRSPPRFVRNYKIQEVIHRRQILLIQVVKEERGTKGAALTTYLSLAGRYCVLMPNSPRGGGVSRKITSVADRKRLREVIKEVDMPAGMGLIVRTAGANRPKPEIRRDCEYLLRLWDDIRELTMKSVAPALVYEEASLIKRAIRDGYTRDIEEVLVDGEAGWKAARDFMRMLTPQHAAKVQLWRGHDTSLFHKNQVEMQLDAMLSPTVQLKSGGYLVINQTEALVAIDVNSGRSTRERNIEETALRTNLEAADEAARQLRLRDLAGLIVIDFIDMESRKHNAMVEGRMKNALKNDRARIQVGSISHFGLLEMSRQRLRPSLAETAFITCPHCMGTGTVRSVESAAIHVLRAIEDEAARHRSAEINVYVAGAVAMYILNQKRDRLMTIERTHGLQIVLSADDKLVPPQVRIEKVRAFVASDAPLANGSSPIAMDYAARDESVEDEDRGIVRNAALVADAPLAEVATVAETAPAAGAPVAVTDEARGDESGERRRRRRRRRRGRRDNGENGLQAENGQGDAEGDEGDEFEGEDDGLSVAPEPGPAPQEPAVPPFPMPVPAPGPYEPGHEPELPGVPGEPGPEIVPPAEPSPDMTPPVAGEDGEARRSRRGRRGGRGRDRRPEAPAETPVPAAAWRGPTPAEPFFDQIDALFATIEPDLEPAKPAAAKPVAAVETVEVAVVDRQVADADVSTVELVESLLSAPVETAEAEPAVADASPVEAEAVLTEVVPAKKPRASRARKPKVTEAAVETPVVEPAPAEEPAPVEAVAEAAAEAVPAKPVRRRTTRAKAAAVVETVAEPAAPAVLVDELVAAESESAAPVIKPVVIGADTPAAEKRRGWWKR